jgi:hypothetical protein
MFKLPNILSYTQDLLIQSTTGEKSLEVLIPFPDVLDTMEISVNRQIIGISIDTLIAITNWQKVKTNLRMDMLDGEEVTSEQLSQLQQLSNYVSMLIYEDYENNNR